MIDIFKKPKNHQKTQKYYRLSIFPVLLGWPNTETSSHNTNKTENSTNIPKNPKTDLFRWHSQ
jgi:hypothetical protein